MRPRSGGHKSAGLSTVDRAARTLELLADQPTGLGLGALAQALGVKPQTAQGLVRSLEAHDLVVQIERGGPYLLGPRVHELSQRWMARCDRGALARGPVAALAKRLNEVVLLAEMHGPRVATLLEAHADQPLSVAYGFELRDDPHVMATGKVLLAYMAPLRRTEVLAGLDLRKRGPRSLTSQESLERELRAVRQRGYATTRDEAAEGICAVAVPVRDAAGEVRCALGVPVPGVRFGHQRAAEILDGLRRTAAEIERRWGLAKDAK